MRRLPLALFLTAAAVAAALAVTATGAPTDEVTLQAERFWSPACHCYKFRFAGVISSGAPNEYVSVLEQKCGSKFSTAIAGASTREGGVWEVESNGPVGPSPTFRARWNGHLSDPVTHRDELQIWLTQLGGGTVRVGVSSFTTPLNLKGRLVELQRLNAGQWTRVRATRFVGRRGRFSATFTVKRRGLTLRAFIPAKSAAPCYAATASKQWTSGPAAPAGSDRIIDRTYQCSVAMWGGIRRLSVGAAGLVPTEVVPKRGVSASSTWTDGPLAGASTDSVWLNPTRCVPSTIRIEFGSRGLEGGSVGNSRRQFHCETPSRVLVRLRAVFAAPAAFVEDRTWGYRQLLAQGQVTEANLGVRTLSGKPFALASFTQSGPVRLFVASSCVDSS